MAAIECTDETVKRLAELAALFGDDSPGAALAGVVERFHAAYVGANATMPAGWQVRDDLTLSDLEAYFDAYNEEPSGSLWHERGRAIRAAVTAGWIAKPDGVGIADVGQLKPATAARIKNALDAHYIRLVTDDPK